MKALKMILIGALWMITDSVIAQNFEWIRQFGTGQAVTQAFGISADASDVYLIRSTIGTLPGQTSSGDSERICAQILC